MTGAEREEGWRGLLRCRQQTDEAVPGKPAMDLPVQAGGPVGLPLSQGPGFALLLLASLSMQTAVTLNSSVRSLAGPSMCYGQA